MILGRLACKVYERLKRETAAVKIQSNTRKHQAEKAYKALQVAVLVVQTGLRNMEARERFGFRRQTKAATIIQVYLFVILHC